MAGGFFGWLFNTGYEDGYEAGTEYRNQGGESASDNTIDSIRQKHNSRWDEEEFSAGWRNAERDSQHGFLWKLFNGG